MNKYGSLLLAAGLFCAPVARAADHGGTSAQFKVDGKEVTLARYAKAFIGENNVTVEVAPYKSGDQAGAILLFHGIESPWDGKALNHEVHDQGYGQADYITMYKGKDWHTLLVRGAMDGPKTYELWVPEVKDGIQVVPSDGAAQLTNPRRIFEEYQAQQAPQKETAK